MFKCWSCGTEHESNTLSNDQLRSAYDAGYRKGIEDMRRVYVENNK